MLHDMPYAASVNRTTRWLLPAVLAALVLIVLLGALIH
jgi:hypothetical protein